MVPADLADRLHDLLRSHFAGHRDVEVVVEQRSRARRRIGERRRLSSDVADDRRQVRGVDGRRVEDRRVPTIAVTVPPLPRRVARHADRIVFVERLEPAEQQLEDADTARLVLRIQSGEAELFSELYMRYFDRVYSYLLVALRDRHLTEDAAQNVFMRVLEALPRYEWRRQPFRTWLFTIVKNHAIDQLKERYRLEPREADEIHRRRDRAASKEADDELPVLDWITDRELMLFVDRLPLVQRQVLMLRFMLDLSTEQIAAVLDRSTADVRMLQSRALRFLRERLAAMGRRTERTDPVRMRRWPRQLNVLRSRRFALRS